MDRLIRTTTEHFLGMLEDQSEFFSPEQLLNAGFPDFLVKRIELELMRNLQDSVKPPESDWANMSTKAVQEAWNRFLQAIHEEIRLPASYAASVLEASLADILDLMVSPRAFVPEYIFGNENELALKVIRERCEGIVVYSYFSTALPRFMEKKGRDKLTKEQADRIIERLDERITAHYTSLNWAQLFDPWFTLLGETVEPGLFATFFRDKGKPGVARLFDAEQEPIHRNRLIEILSKPQLDEIDDDIADVGEELLSPEGVSSDENIYLDSSTESDVDQPSGEVSGGDPGGRTERESGKTPDWDTEKPSGSDSNEMVEKKDDQPETQSEDEGNLITRYQKTNGNDKHDPPLHSRLQNNREEDDEDIIPLYSKLKPSDDEEDSGSVPIWRRFSEDPADESAADESSADESSADKSAHDVSISEDTTTGKSPWDDTGSEDSKDALSEVDDLPYRMHDPSGGSLSDAGTSSDGDDGSVQDPETESSREQLDIRSYVKDMEKEFVEELFGGDEDAFIETIEKISRLKTWKEAGSYISREVFDRNMIDIYSDSAIYFTDRMQTYFLERD